MLSLVKYESNKFDYYFNILYSSWVKKNFKHCGKFFNVKKPTYFKGLRYISIGDNFNARENLRIECWDKFSNKSYNPIIEIGENVTMNFNIHIGCINKIIIGNNVLFSSNIFITDHFHGFINSEDIQLHPIDRELYSKGPVIIEDDVWIGENVSIMPNVTIGKNCIIGANSVVTKSFPSNSVIAGVPAVLIKTI